MRRRKGCLVPVLLALLGAGIGSWGGAATGATASAGSEGLPESQSFAFLGYVKDGSNTLGIIETLGLVFLVREGDTILGTYRVKHLGEDFALLQDGEREIRAASRPPQPGLLGRQDEERSGRPTAWSGITTLGPPPEPSGNATPSGQSTGQGIVQVSPSSAQAAGVSGSSTPAAVPSQPPAAEENPFLRAVEAAREGRQTPLTPEENPFLRALRERSSAPTVPEDNPFLRALRRGGQTQTSPDENPFIRALREKAGRQ